MIPAPDPKPPRIPASSGGLDRGNDTPRPEQQETILSLLLECAHNPAVEAYEIAVLLKRSEIISQLRATCEASPHSELLRDLARSRERQRERSQPSDDSERLAARTRALLASLSDQLISLASSVEEQERVRQRFPRLEYQLLKTLAIAPPIVTSTKLMPAAAKRLESFPVQPLPLETERVLQHLHDITNLYWAPEVICAAKEKEQFSCALKTEGGVLLLIDRLVTFGRFPTDRIEVNAIQGQSTGETTYLVILSDGEKVLQLPTHPMLEPGERLRVPLIKQYAFDFATPAKDRSPKVLTDLTDARLSLSAAACEGTSWGTGTLCTLLERALTNRERAVQLFDTTYGVQLSISFYTHAVARVYAACLATMFDAVSPSVSVTEPQQQQNGTFVIELVAAPHDVARFAQTLCAPAFRPQRKTWDGDIKLSPARVLHRLIALDKRNMIADPKLALFRAERKDPITLELTKNRDRKLSREIPYYLTNLQREIELKAQGLGIPLPESDDSSYPDLLEVESLAQHLSANGLVVHLYSETSLDSLSYTLTEGLLSLFETEGPKQRLRRILRRAVTALLKDAVDTRITELHEKYSDPR